MSAAYFSRTSACLPQHMRPSGQGPVRQRGPAAAKICGASGSTSLSISSATARISHWARLQQRRLKKFCRLRAVHRHDHLGLAGVGQHKAGVLDGLLGGLAAVRPSPPCPGPRTWRCAASSRRVGQSVVGILLRRRSSTSDELGLGFGDGLDLRRDDIAEMLRAGHSAGSAR